MIAHIFGLLRDPVTEWKKLGEESDRTFNKGLLSLLFLGLIPSIGMFYGTTQTGWSISGGDVLKLTVESAIPLAVLFYFAIIGGMIFIGLMMHWMSQTYNAESSPIKGVVFIGYCCIPVYLAGILAVYPVWWVDVLVATAAFSYVIRLIYLGISDVLHIPEDISFLYASAVFAIALVYVVMVLTATVILWEFVATPVFTN